jgi:hypothetical protein
MILRGMGAALIVAAPLAVAHAESGGQQATLSPAEVVRRLEDAGYTKIHDLEFDDGRWELEATSPAGIAVDLDVDGTTGKILHEETDD